MDTEKTQHNTSSDGAPLARGVAGAVAEPPTIVDGRLALAGLAATFYLAVFFPYIQLVPLPTDTQPYALLLSVLVLLAVRSRGMPMEIVLLFFTFLFSLALVVFGGGEFVVLRSIANYTSLFFIAFATYLLLKATGGFSAAALRWVVYAWFAVGLIQTLVYPDFLVALIGRGLGTSGFGGRGVVGLSPEPTHYGMFCIFLLFLTLLHAQALSSREVKRLSALLIIQIVFFAQSAMAVLCLGILLAYYLGINFLGGRRVLPVLGGFTLIAGAMIAALQLGWFSLEQTRIFALFRVLLDNPSLLVRTDASVYDRVFHIYYSFLGFFQNFLLPHGYTAWPEYVDTVLLRYGDLGWWVTRLRILSGYGSAFFELGLVAILIPLAITLALYRYYRADRRSFLVMALFLNTILLTAIPLAFPLLGFVVGYLAYHSRFRYQET